jgi:MFS transporter, NNP family, nitrate/nitrite transporter
LFLKMANGGTYSIVPFINKHSMGSVAGIVGAGGNLGAMLVAFLFKSPAITYSQAFYYIGIGVLLIGIVLITVNMSSREVADISVSKGTEQLQRA